jgi:serine/threonine protein phosphatase PrpC
VLVNALIAEWDKDSPRRPGENTELHFDENGLAGLREVGPLTFSFMPENQGELWDLVTGDALHPDEKNHYKITLAPGEALFIFTDGVTEAMNNADELFTEARLEKMLLPLAQKPVQEIADQVMQEIDIFSAGIPQTDDITMLVLRYNGEKENP